ncbi:SNF2 family N-terminal domain-containing protein [Cladorrhinum sp. PSN332]|nr:SNF2 family N-terminal domain-containing protein [Cladorrhinum sp. PSN332]
MNKLPNRSKKRHNNHDEEFDPKRRRHDSQTDQLNDLMEVDIESYLEDDSNSVVCYGALFSAKAQATFLLNLITPPWVSYSTFPIISQDNNCFLLTCSTNDDIQDFAQLDLITTRYLNALQSLNTVTSMAVVSSSNLSKIPTKTTRKKTIIDITVNILGPDHLAETVGNLLSAVACCLQHPVYLHPNMQYKNPHYFYPNGIMSDLRHCIGPAITDTDSVRVGQKIENVLESLGDLGAVESGIGDKDIITAINKHLVNTSLKDHQINGVRFIVGRENPSICQDADRELWRLVDPMFMSRLQLPGLGGILADVMGLGKTLTMLSAIVYSKCEARSVHQTGLGDNTALRPSAKATLVVLPSRQLLDVWNAEIMRHFLPGTLSVAVFHQHSRAKTSDELVSFDVVLTTYHTLAADWRGMGVLQNIPWPRVVLDEAHWIRNQATGLFKAAAKLKAERRWCLTGTPIQNNLHDLRSLLKFLRHGPLSETKHFEEYINGPIRKDPNRDESFRNLQALLRTVCLRRTEALLQLPPFTTEIVRIKLSPAEQAAYSQVERDCLEEYERQLCTKSKVNTSALLFDTILKRRRLCNHGTYIAETTHQRSPSPSGRRRKSMKQAAQEMPGGDSCVLCGSKDEDVAASLEGAQECPLCCRSLVAHISTSQELGSTSWLTVPAAVGRGSSSRGSQTPSPIGSPLSPSPGLAGYSSKLTAITENIYESCATPGNKSIVFTSWRTTLDLLGILLTQQKIPFLRIDGSIPSTDRSTILAEFNTSPAIPVLLLTIDSGAVGLTITSANRVHIVEPIYNPATEAQAIARVLRMGQTRPVTIVKYITEKTVEPNIVALQERKRRLAKFSLDDRVKDGDSDSLDDLKFILDTSRDIPVADF